MQPSPLGFVSRIPTPPGARRASHSTSDAALAASRLPPPAARSDSLEPADVAGTGATPELLAKREPGAAGAQAAAPAPPTSREAATLPVSAYGEEAAAAQGPALGHSSAQARLRCWLWQPITTITLLACTEGCNSRLSEDVLIEQGQAAVLVGTCVG